MKRGFTLIELLAVIVILSIIALIAVPIVVNIINDSKKSSQKESIKMYAKAVENAVGNYFLKHPNEKSVTIEQLEGLINYSGERIECETTKIYSNGKIYLKDCTVGGEKIDYIYGEKQRDPNIIVDLTPGLTPVVYDGDNWIVVDKNDSNWYDYDEQQWANAVVLGTDEDGNEIEKNPGDVVAVDGTEVKMMLVYIPRYEYNYKKLEIELPEDQRNTPPEIEINFIRKNVITPSDDTKYKVHPAFMFGEEQINGFWVGKFEISHKTKSKGNSSSDLNANLNCTSEVCNESKYLRVLPNVPSLRYNNVSNFWYAFKNIQNSEIFKLSNTDTHMIKNIDWGAIAYLAQSKYGKYNNNIYKNSYKRMFRNKSKDYITGNSNGTSSSVEWAELTPQCEYDDMTILDIGRGMCGPGASTTGNIYGVYDMVGGAREYVMGANGEENNPTVMNSGFVNNAFTAGKINKKYYNVYFSDYLQACNGICYGHALSETRMWYSSSFNWFHRDSKWLLRGGLYSDTNAGLFAVDSWDGSGSRFYSSRIVAIAK